MKVFIQSRKNGIPHNYNIMSAYQGFYEMGFEVIPFYDNNGLRESSREDIVVVRSTKDLIGCGIQGVDQEVYCSEVVKFEAEWRCFVRYGQILSVRQYKGDWRRHYDPEVIENAVKEFRSAPAGYAIDFGLTDDGRTLLIEFNDGYALGCYGLFYIDYAKLLSARWAELTGTEDECAFDIR